MKYKKWNIKNMKYKNKKYPKQKTKDKKLLNSTGKILWLVANQTGTVYLINVLYCSYLVVD